MQIGGERRKCWSSGIKQRKVTAYMRMKREATDVSVQNDVLDKVRQ